MVRAQLVLVYLPVGRLCALPRQAPRARPCADGSCLLPAGVALLGRPETMSVWTEIQAT